MERFVRLVSPTGPFDFIGKLIVILLMCGVLNHVRDWLLNGENIKWFSQNLADASFTALPMCAGGLALIGHLNRLQNTLKLQAIRDALTGLRNRRWFMERWRTPAQSNALLLLIDIDHFKSVNDMYGHPFGDRALETFARQLEKIVPEGSYAARLGGEEFAVVLEGYSISQATQIATQIAQGCQVSQADGPTHWIASSVGGTHFIPGPTTLCAALARADEALYLAKGAGRAQFKFLASLRASQAVQKESPVISRKRAVPM